MVWDVWAGADVCVGLTEDVCMEELGVSYPALVWVESMSKVEWLAEAGTS